MIERTNGWVKRARRTAVDHERTPESSVAMVHLATTRIMLNRLTDAKPEFPFRYPKRTKQA